MSRPLRIEVAGGVYHVTNRGLERREIVRDDRDRRKWEELLDRTATRRRWSVFAWALMDNHFHLFLRTPEADLSAGMHDLQSGYASVFNRRHARRGPLFQSRFKAVLVEAEWHEWELTRYVHLNPVRAGVVRRAEDYAWSSARFYLAARGAPKWLAWEEVLARYGSTLRTARRAYAEYLAEGLEARLDSPLRRAVAGTLLGSEPFVERIKKWLQDRLPDREVPAARGLRERLSIEAVEAAVCRVFGAEAGQLRRRRLRSSAARGVALYLSRNWTNAPVTALGEHFGGISGQAVSTLVARVTRRLGENPVLARQLRECEDALRLML